MLRTSHVAHNASLLVNMYITHCCARRLPLPKVDTCLYSTACRLVSDCGVTVTTLGAQQPGLLKFYRENFAALQPAARPQSHGLQSIMTSCAKEMNTATANLLEYGTPQHQARCPAPPAARGGAPRHEASHLWDSWG